MSFDPPGVSLGLATLVAVVFAVIRRSSVRAPIPALAIFLAGSALVLYGSALPDDGQIKMYRYGSMCFGAATLLYAANHRRSLGNQR